MNKSEKDIRFSQTLRLKVKEMSDYAWANREALKDIPKNQLLRLVVKTTAPTDHREDKTLPEDQRVIRVYPEEELKLAARSLIHKEVGLNHKVSTGGFVVDAEWNNELKQIEAFAQVPEAYVNLVRSKKITTCSADIYAREKLREGETEIYNGIWLDGVSLVEEPFTAGDPNATVLAENKLFFMVEAIHVGEPFAGYADFADCVAKNQDKEDPEAYCGQIQAQAETALKEALAEKDRVIGEKDARIVELEGAVTKLQDNAKAFDQKLAEGVAAAKQEGKQEVIAKVEGVLPQAFIMRQGAGGLQRLTHEVKRVLRECRDGQS